MNKEWEIRHLGELCEFFNGLWKGKKAPYVDVGVIRNTNFTKDGYLDDTDIAYLDVEEKQYARRKLVYGDIILEKSGGGPKQPVGRVILFDKKKGEFSFSNFTSVIRIINKGQIDFQFLHKYLFFCYVSGLIEPMQHHSTGIRNLDFKLYKEIQVPIPPLPEQKCIVKILDKAFAAIDKAKANTEKNLQNSRELFESYLNKIFSNPGDDSSSAKATADKWEEKKLSEIAFVTGGYSFKSKDFKKEGEYQVIRMGNVRPGIIRENENPVFIDKLDDNVLKKALLLPNDIIITQTGTKKKRDYGFTVIIEKENYLLNQRISAIRFSENYLPKFFLYFSWTNHFKDQYFANETGTVGQGNVGIGAITNAIVPFPSINVQQNIVQKLDELSVETKKLETIYQQKINDLEELKKSILQKAFNGELL